VVAEFKPRQIEVHIAEPIVPEPSSFEVQISIEKLKRFKSPDIDQIPAEMIRAGVSTLHSEIHNLINSIWKKEELPQQLKEFVTVPIYKKGNKTDYSNYRGLSLLPSA
jgi:hypothetical protein